MALSMIQSQNSTSFVGQNYEIILNQSLLNLLDSLHKQKSADFFNFSSIFYQLLQCKSDPPLETIWVYSALSYLDSNSSKVEPLDQFTAIKDLFQLIISCSVSCSPLKCIALTAPVVFKLHKFVVNLKGFELGPKREKKVKREIKGLIGQVLGYINVCLEGLDAVSSDGSEQNLIRPLGDLIGIWNEDRMVKDGNQEGLKEFFPLLSAGIVDGISGGGCDLSELAGFVVAEVFLLKLCLELNEGDLNEELENRLRSWIVGSITGLGNSYFFGTLVMMLLEPSLPVASLMDPKAESLLKKILYDAVMLVDYSFLTPERLINLPTKHLKRISMSRLLLFHEAIESLRKQAEEQKKVISYINAFSSSSLPTQLIKLVRGETGLDVEANGPNGTSPKAFLRWILNLENRGLKILDDCLSKSRCRLILDNLVEYPEEPVSKDGKYSDADLCFYIDKEGVEEDGNDEDQVMAASVSAAFVAAAQSMQSTEHGSTKRKSKDAEKEKQPKFLKYGRYENAGVSQEKPTDSSNNDMSRDSEVDNPSSDED